MKVVNPIKIVKLHYKDKQPVPQFLSDCRTIGIGLPFTPMSDHMYFGDMTINHFYHRTNT